MVSIGIRFIFELEIFQIHISFEIKWHCNPQDTKMSNLFYTSVSQPI